MVTGPIGSSRLDTTMTKQEVALLAFRLAGIYALVQTYEYATAAIWYLSWGDSMGLPTETQRLGLLVSAGEFLLLFLVGIGLLVGSRRLATWTFRHNGPAQLEERFLALHAFSYSLVGLFILAWAMSDLGQFAGLMIANSPKPGSSSWMLALEPGIALLLKLALGLGLFFGSHGLVQLWSRLRYSGLRRQMGLCVHCAYDLAVNTSGVCPECGTRIENLGPG